MRGAIMAASLAAVLGAASAQAGQNLSSLQGAWTDQSLSCTDVFNKGADGKMSLRSMDDFNVGGFIVEGDKIKGQNRACTISRARQTGNKISLLLACQDSVMFSTQEIFLTVQSDGTVKRKLQGFSDFSQTFKRCS